MYDQQVGHPLPLRTSSVFVSSSRGIKRNKKTTAPGILPIARKSKPRLIDCDVLHGQAQGEEYLSEHYKAQHGERDVLCGHESEGFMYKHAVEGGGDVEQFDHGKQGDVSESAMQERGKDAAASTVQAGASTSRDQRRGKRVINDMRGLHDLLNTSMSSFKKDMKDTELGSLRILEKDVMDKAISKAIFKRGKTMALKGNFYYR